MASTSFANSIEIPFGDPDEHKGRWRHIQTEDELIAVKYRITNVLGNYTKYLNGENIEYKGLDGLEIGDYIAINVIDTEEEFYYQIRTSQYVCEEMEEFIKNFYAIELYE